MHLGADVLQRFEKRERSPLPSAAPSPLEAHERYLAWLARSEFQTGAALFTQETRRFLAGGPYSWALQRGTRPALEPFADALVWVEGFRRIEGGDNRPLPRLASRDS